MGMEFSSREAVIKAMKDYTIRRGIDYRVYESEPTIFYAKCTQYGAEAIRPLVEVDPSIKVKSVIVKVQSRFNYTISYRKAWLAKKKAMESIFGGWEASYEVLPIWFEAMCHKEPSAVFIIGDGNNMYDFTYVGNVAHSHLCADRALASEGEVSKKAAGDVPLKDSLITFFVSQDGNNNIVPIAFAIVEGETSDAWSAIGRSNRAWSPPRAFYMFCIRYIESNFLRKFKEPYLQKFIVNIGYSRIIWEYQMRYQRLRKRSEAYTNWLDWITREQYPLAFDGGYLWGHMTTNLVEMNELFTRKRAEVEARINAGHVFFELLTYADNGATVVNSKLTEFHVDMYLLVVQISGWISKYRPKMTRFLNEMDTRMLHGPRHCKQCGAESHNHSRCRQSGGPSAGPVGE
ncbi:uncharacterized protein LOC127745470 [Arachis duranensis]|uniref:Uncharacterized protein LOC127745470 n=1 Tax=Arachis duranensis TaxID=130453 RepID=A0A9C6WG46_ARADU|nr:uncharacterized protein LOC127745470 [Arachis duranensis]